MRLRRLDAHFGVLDGRAVAFPDGRAHVIVDRNERGKSTLVAAIVAALYGLGPRHERETFQPRHTGRFEVTLDVDAGGRHLSVHRNFNTGTCVVRELRSGHDVTADFQTGKSRWSVGQVLLGLSREQFARSALVRQGELASLGLGRDASPLKTRIQQLVDTEAGEYTAAAAIQALDDALRGYEGVTLKSTGMVESEVRRVQTRIATVERDLDAMLRQRASLHDDAERLVSLRAAAAALRERRQERLRLAGVAEAAEAAERLAADDDRARRLADLHARRQTLASVPDLDPSLVERLAQLDGAIDALEPRMAEHAAALRLATDAYLEIEARLERGRSLRGAGASDADEVFLAAERRRHAEAAEAHAARRSDEARARVSAEQRDLALHFEGASRADLDELSRYHDRRHAHLVGPEGPRTSSPRSVSPRMVAALAILCAGAIVAFALVRASWWIGAIAAFGAVGAAVARAARRPRDTRSAGRGDAPTTADGTRERAHEAIAELDRRAAAAAARLGYRDILSAVAALRRWHVAQPDVQAAGAARRAHEEAREHLRVASEDASRLLARWGRPIRQGESLAIALEALHRDVLASIRDAAALAGARHELDQARRRRDAVARQRDELAEQFVEIAGSSAGDARERAASLEALRGQLALLHERVGVDAQIRELTSALLAGDERERLASAASPVRSTEGRPADRSERYRADVEALLRDAEAAEREAHRIELALGGALDAFELSYPQMEAELAELRLALERAEGFRRAATLAGDVLEEVAREVHRGWSARLNAAASDALASLGGKHAEVRFDDELGFVVLDRGTREEWGRDDVDRLFSAGARDQVYLAVRLALASYFSAPDDPLPLLLDDPFATSDDERFAAAMAYLVERAAERQVIVLTCHEQRHRWWLETQPEMARNVDVLSLHEDGCDVGSGRGDRAVAGASPT